MTKSTRKGAAVADHRRWPTVGASLVLVVGLAGTSSAHGQFFQKGPKPVVFEHAHVLTMTGRELDDAVIITRGGVIQQVGVGIEIPDDARVIDVSGLTVTPGLIDVNGALGLAGASGSSALHFALDVFDPFDMNTFRDAVRNGVTTVYLSPGGGAGVNGRGCVIRLAPRADGGGAGEQIEGVEALHIDLGSGGTPIERLHTYNGVWQSFKDALLYRESLDTYKEELEEYETKIKERAEKEAKEGGGDGNGGGSPQGQAGQPADNKADRDDIKKPAEPQRNPEAETLLRIIDHELSVRIRANRDADILNALQLATDFDIDIVIEGAAEAHLAADELAEAGVSVILDPWSERSGFSDDEYQRRQADLARVLDGAGVDWVIGTGGRWGNQSRFVLFRAQEALSHERVDSSARALEVVTAGAAQFLGLSDQIGTIDRGRSADLVLWAGDPRGGAAVVDSVYIGGRQVYRRTPVPGIGE